MKRKAGSTTEQQEFLSAGDVAIMCGVTVVAVRQAVLAGRLRVAGATVGGYRLFLVEDVRTWRAEAEKTRVASHRAPRVRPSLLVTGGAR